MPKNIVIVGGGFGGLAVACLLAQDGHQVTVLEKNDQLGGRAGLLEKQGFRFDTGPSWYLMPDVFERFFESLGERVEDHLQLTKLSPSYRVYFKDQNQYVDMTGDLDQDTALFESIEKGAGDKLRKYLRNSQQTYDISVGKFLYKNYNSVLDFFSPELMRSAPKVHLFSNMDRYVRKYFRDQRLQQIMQYPLVFLGSSPYNAPALYNLMSHVDFNQGVYYPQGGMYELVKALVKLGTARGVQYRTKAAVSEIHVEHGKVLGVVAGGERIAADVVISDADIHHTEQQLLAPEYRDHTEDYWSKRVMAPSALLMYLGVDKTYDNIQHHNLVFSCDWQANFAEIFDHPAWPNDPSFYVCAPSKTDPTVAPKGQENIFVLVPIAPGIEDSKQLRDIYADKIIMTMEREMNMPDLRKHIIFRELRAVDDFVQRYNSYKGTGLGLAHTLFQSALFRPSNQSRKARGLYYVGANVHPGIGLPVVLISAELARQRVNGR